MPDFRVIQISDTHLSTRFPRLVENFHRVADTIDDARPNLVINTGDLAFDGPEHPEDLVYARSLHDALPAPCRFLPGNHDIGDNPTGSGGVPTQMVSDANRVAYLAAFGDDRWRFDAAGWTLIGLNSLVMNSGLACEGLQFDWLASQLVRTDGKPVAVFIHKPLYKNAPEDSELKESSFRYVPMPARRQLVELLQTVNLRLVASGHVHQRRDHTARGIRHIWAPSTSFVIRSDARQEPIGVKEVGLVEYTFKPDGVEVRHRRAEGQIDIDLEAELAADGQP